MLGFSSAPSSVLLALALLLGLCMGSFCNNWAFRLSRGQSVTKGRSKCPHCGHALGALDLVPLFSYCFLRGRCRYCRGPISPRYPLTELLMAAAYGSLLWRFDPITQWPELLRWAVLFLLFLVLALVDWETWELPDGLVLAGALWFAALVPFTGGLSALIDGLIGSVAIAGPVLVLVLIADKLLGRETMGGGDIKLLAMLGLHLGASRMLLLLILASVFGILFSLLPCPAPSADTEPGDEEPLPESGRFRSIPFGPAILTAAWVTALFGNQLITWYTTTFF